MSCYSPSCKLGNSLAVMVFIFLLLVNGSHQRRQPVAAEMEKATVTITATMTAEFSGISKEMKVVHGGRGKVVHPEWHLNYMSKRRVPNGPDPIHNRRAGNSGRPPGKA
ncbi:uncharacterized protein LOC120076488 [Benincasa hispida]|uniref:uncharacterized protein LOC120076488 n=1 Tax=Benincasa hispida TaxID=102211 RepID=UPI001900DE2F|nr:uncharacterized protein LOC120076488 [Benincasa hispida]